MNIGTPFDCNDIMFISTHTTHHCANGSEFAESAFSNVHSSKFFPVSIYDPIISKVSTQDTTQNLGKAS